MHIRFFLWVLIALVIPVGSLSAQSALRVVPQVMFETLSPKPGSNVRVAIVLSPKDGWHTYWSFAGDAGAPLRTQWNAPDGFAFSPILHPSPSRLDVSGIVSFVHDGEHVLLQTMKVPAGMAEGTPVPLSVNLDWLSCSSNQCVPERQSLRFTMVIGKGEVDFPGLSKIRQAESKLPRSLAGVSLRRQGDFWLFRIPGSYSRASIFPDSGKWFGLDSPQIVTTSDSETYIKVKVLLPDSLESSFSGIIDLGESSYRVDKLVPALVRDTFPAKNEDEKNSSPESIQKDSSGSDPVTPSDTPRISIKTVDVEPSPVDFVLFSGHSGEKRLVFGILLILAVSLGFLLVLFRKK